MAEAVVAAAMAVVVAAMPAAGVIPPVAVHTSQGPGTLPVGHVMADMPAEPILQAEAMLAAAQVSPAMDIPRAGAAARLAAAGAAAIGAAGSGRARSTAPG